MSGIWFDKTTSHEYNLYLEKAFEDEDAYLQEISRYSIANFVNHLFPSGVAFTGILEATTRIQSRWYYQYGEDEFVIRLNYYECSGELLLEVAWKNYVFSYNEELSPYDNVTIFRTQDNFTTWEAFNETSYSDTFCGRYSTSKYGTGKKLDDISIPTLVDLIKTDKLPKFHIE